MKEKLEISVQLLTNIITSLKTLLQKISWITQAIFFPLTICSRIAKQEICKLHRKKNKKKEKEEIFLICSEFDVIGKYFIKLYPVTANVEFHEWYFQYNDLLKRSPGFLSALRLRIHYTPSMRNRCLFFHVLRARLWLCLLNGSYLRSEYLHFTTVTERPVTCCEVPANYF